MPMKYPGKGLTDKMKKYVRLVAAGYTQQGAAAELGMSDYWGSKVIHRPDAMEEYALAIKEKILPIYAKALNLMDRQVGSANEWIAQGAARDLLSRFDKQIMQKDEKQEIVIRLTGGEIELGEPEFDGGDVEEPVEDEEPDS